MTQLIFYSLIGGVFSLVGGLVLLSREDLARKIMTPLLAFAAGAFLGVTFLDILPEAIGLVEEPDYVLIAVLAGFIAFFILERFLMFFKGRQEDHEHSEHTEFLAPLLVAADSVHNFLDGIIIALAYIANPVLGLTTTIGVAAHEIPQEIGDFSVLLNQGWSRKKIILVNILQSLLTIPGVLIGFYLGGALGVYLPYLLAAVGGIFLYIAASDLIPEIHHKTSHRHFYRVIIPLLASLVLIWYLIRMTHGE